MTPADLSGAANADSNDHFACRPVHHARRRCYWKPNAPEPNRKSLAKLAQQALVQELSARTFGATGNANLNAFGQNIKITGQIKASLSDPMKLKVEIPKMQNFKQSGPRMTINVDLPFDISGSAAGGPITVTLGKTPVNLHLEVEADVKLTSPNGKTKAEVTIRHWDGGLNNLNLGNDPASQALKQAIKQLLEQNRDVANKALKLPPRKGEPNSTFR